MFSGLVEHLGQVSQIIPEPPGCRLVIDAGPVAEDSPLGASIAINGCCLTVVETLAEGLLTFQAGPETLARTNLGQLTAGDRVNLERSLKLGDRLGGHLVTGHIDAVATVHSRQEQGEWRDLWFQVPEPLSAQMAPKGSVAVDGVSLTLVDVQPGRFSVSLIPHTLAVTTLGGRQPGDRVNIETDLLAKYVQSQLQPSQQSPQDSSFFSPGLSTNPGDR